MTEKRFREVEQRVTVDFDEESYYLDGEYWTSWDHYGEQMADAINMLLNEVSEENEQLKNKCGNYKQALLDLGINVNILNGTGN